MAFKKDFVWGVATASYQIEGGYNADGKLLSVWDDFSHKQGNIEDNQTGDIACDHYNRYYEVVCLLMRMNVVIDGGTYETK